MDCDTMKRLIKDNKANTDMIVTGVIAAVLFAVSIPIIFSIMGGIDTSATDTDFQLASGTVTTSQENNSADWVSKGLIPWNSSFTTNITLTYTPNGGTSAFSNVSMYNTTLSCWMGVPSANWSWDSPVSGNLSVDSYLLFTDVQAIRCNYSRLEPTITPAGNSSDNLIANVETFFSIGPIYLVVIAAVGIIGAILILRKQ